jgi:hypothetical protein
LKKSILVWTHKLTNLRLRKHKIRIGLWAGIAVREIAFSRVRLVKSTFLERTVFAKMKSRLKMRLTFLKRICFKGWMLFVRRAKQSVKLAKLTSSFALSRTFGLWKFLFVRLDEERQIEFLKERVSEPYLKRRTFRFWLDRAVANFRENQMKAIRYRKFHLRQLFFESWKQFGIRQNRVAVGFYEHGLIRRIFNGFKLGTKDRMDELSAVAYGFCYELLKRKYFYRFRILIEGKQLEDDIDEVVLLLNGPLQLRSIRRL